MKRRCSKLAAGVSMAVLACATFVQPAYAAADRLSGEGAWTGYIECLGTYLNIEWDFERVRVDHADGVNYTSRQKGIATDLYSENTWKFSAHFSFKNKNLVTGSNPRVRHVIDRNILISQQPDVPNLLIMTTMNLVTANGDLAAEKVVVSEVTCIAQ